MLYNPQFHEIVLYASYVLPFTMSTDRTQIDYKPDYCCQFGCQGWQWLGIRNGPGTLLHDIIQCPDIIYVMWHAWFVCPSWTIMISIITIHSIVETTNLIEPIVTGYFLSALKSCSHDTSTHELHNFSYCFFCFSRILYTISFSQFFFSPLTVCTCLQQCYSYFCVVLLTII